MKDSGIPWVGMIPADWKVLPAGGVFTEVKEKNHNNQYSNPFSFRYGEIVDKKIGDIDESMEETLSAYRVVSPNTIMLNGLNLNYDFITQRVAIVQKKGIITSAYLAVKPDETRVVPRFMLYLLKSYDFRQVLHGIGSGIRKTLKYQDFKDLKIITPDMETQKQVVDYLDAECAKIDSIIAEAKAGIEEYRLWKESTIQEAVTRGLHSNVEMVDTNIFWIGAIPKHWKLEKLKRCTSMLTPMRDKPEHLDGDIPWIRIEDYDGKYISKSKEGLGVSSETVNAMNLKIYPVGTVLCTSSCDLGKCAIVSRELVSNQRFIGIIPNENMSPDYLYYLMLSNAKRLNYLSTGSIQANLSRVAFEQLLVQVPPFDEQVEIATFLDEKISQVDALINEKTCLISDLESYKKSLIYEVVTGKRKVV